jgi:MFS family permease
MQLEEMKNLWDEMSLKIDSQQQLTNKLIMEMTQQKFRNRFSTLSLYETSGAVICFIAATFILLNLDKMDTWYLMLCGIFSLIILIILPVLSLRAINGLKKLNLSKNSYKETLIEFSKRKKNMMLIQQFSVGISIILMWMVAPVFSKIVNGKDFFMQEHSTGLLLFYAATTIGVIFFARWGYGCYKRITASAEKDLKELEL